MRYAKALLLVDYQQSKPLEVHIFLQNAMGSDQQVAAAVFGMARSLCQLLGRAEATHHFDLDGIAGEPLHSADVMLSGQHGGGHQNGGLLAGQNAFHNGAEGHFGFAEAHVAAQKTIHGMRPLHVALDLLGAHQLIFGLLIGKGFFKASLPIVIG